MKKTAIFLTTLLSLFLLQNISAQTAWAAADRYSALGIGALLQNASVAIGADQSLYVVGDFRNTICFDTIVLSAPVPGRTHGYLLKLDAQMQPVWARQFPEKPYDVALDAQGNVFIAGSRWNAAGSDDTLAYVAKYSSGGSLLATFHSTGTAKTWAKVVRTDAAGNCYVAGERFSSGSAHIGGIALPGGNGRECFIARLSPNLSTVSWAKLTGSSPNLDNVYDLEIDDPNGFVYAAGNYSQNCIGLECLFSIYNGDFYVEKHQLSNGASVWKKIFSGGSGTLTKQFARLSPNGQTLLVAACFKKTTYFSPTLSLTANPGNADYHIYAAEIQASDGSVNWAKKVSTAGDAFLWRMARSGDEAWLAGYYGQTMDVHPFSLPSSATDGFLLKLNAGNGDAIEAERQFGASSDQTFALAHRGGVLAIGGNSESFPNLNIGNGAFVLPGSNPSMFVARKGGQPQLPPIASFASSAVAGCAPLTVQFEDKSAQNPTWLQWQFQGGVPGVSNEKSPTVTFYVPGTYTVTLTAANGGGTSTSTATVQVSNGAPIAASFTANVSGATAQFSGSAPNATSYFWDFGDGNTSTLKNPAHTYAECGTYTVVFSASNNCNSSTTSQTIAIGTGMPVANALLTSDGLSISCTNLSTNAASYLWDFGDGDTSAEINPAHTYAAAGTYTVTLTATNLCGSDTHTLTVEVMPCQTPTAAFAADKKEVCVGESLTLTSLSSNATMLLWTLPGANPMNATEPTVVVTYPQPGTYAVVLNAINACDNVQLIEQAYITVKPMPMPAFEYSASGLKVTFDNFSEDALSYHWDFGDGNASQEASPAHQYAANGAYEVTLTAYNDCGSVSASMLVTVATSHTSTPDWAEKWRIFPNPSSGIFVLDVHIPDEPDVLLGVFNSQGQHLHGEILASGQGRRRHTLDLAGQAPGVYWLRAQSGEKIAQWKLVINR